MQFPNYLYLCTRKRKLLGYGVMVTLQILVLSFLVRIQVAQQTTSFLMTKPAKTAILAGFLFFVVYFQVGKAQKKESSKMNGKLFLHPHRLGDVFLHL